MTSPRSLDLLDLLALRAVGVGLWRQRRELGWTRPWQYLPRYGKSPVAAEEEHRAGTAVGRTMGTAMGCIGSLWMGWQFLGLGWALATCAGLVALTAVVARLLK